MFPISQQDYTIRGICHQPERIKPVLETGIHSAASESVSKPLPLIAPSAATFAAMFTNSFRADIFLLPSSLPRPVLRTDSGQPATRFRRTANRMHTMTVFQFFQHGFGSRIIVCPAVYLLHLFRCQFSFVLFGFDLFLLFHSVIPPSVRRPVFPADARHTQSCSKSLMVRFIS